MQRAAALAFLVLAMSVAFASTAAADPNNKNALPLHFACDNGVTFVAVATVESQTSTGHVIQASDPALLKSVFQVVRITADGQVVKDTPGFDGRPLVNCAIAEAPGVVVSGFFTGNR